MLKSIIKRLKKKEAEVKYIRVGYNKIKIITIRDGVVVAEQIATATPVDYPEDELSAVKC